ncbi:MAG: hypothetical protein E7290_07065 [Lachnospiraceae bacterium]|nr:hypothetical protein [Lachnospiraceae bacterium]
MDKLVWQDYWKGLAWSNIKAYIRNNKNGLWSLIGVSLVWLPYFLADESEQAKMLMNLMKCLTCALPTLFLFWTLALTTLTLPKVLYMSPMTTDERREFVEKKWKLATLVPNIFNLAWTIIGLLCGIDVLSMMFLMFHFMMMSEGAIFYRNRDSKQLESNFGKVFSVYALLGTIVSMLVQIFAIVVVVEDGIIGAAWLGTFLGVVLLLELPLLIRLMTYKKKMILIMANYEAAYDVGSY